MTKEKTIEILNALWRSKDCGYSEREIREALEFAIMHIKKEPCKDEKKMGYFKPALTIAALYSNLKTSKHNYDPDDYVWILGKAVIKELKNPYKYPSLLTFDNEKMTIYGISVVVDHLNRYDIKIFENITEKINVDKKDKEEREHLISYLDILKQNARNWQKSNTLIYDVKLDSFNFAMNSAIKLLKQEPKAGHWVVAEEFGFGNICECSECKESVWIYKDTNTWNYCPKCGIKMEGKNEATK